MEGAGVDIESWCIGDEDRIGDGGLVNSQAKVGELGECGERLLW
jgi:hypothetical protein